MFYFQAIHEELEQAQLDNRRKEEGKEKREEIKPIHARHNHYSSSK